MSLLLAGAGGAALGGGAMAWARGGASTWRPRAWPPRGQAPESAFDPETTASSRASDKAAPGESPLYRIDGGALAADADQGAGRGDPVGAEGPDGAASLLNSWVGKHQPAGSNGAPHPGVVVPTAGSPLSAASIVAQLPSSAIILDSADEVVLASPTAIALGLVRERDLVHTELCQVARQVRRTGGHKDVDFDLARGPLGRGVLSVEARLAALGGGYVLIHATDRTQAKLVEDTRRDFVANVSHELKTPVGGIALLAEAVLDASDDPEAVTRFARRIQTESTRLTRLVQEIVDLSRLQASQSLSEPVAVPVDIVIREAIDTVTTVATARGITLSVSVPPDLVVYGDEKLLVTAVSNLLTNAINYSPDGTKVAVVTRQVGGIVEISVSDQGVGIARSEQGRIFERFYRVDPARSRATGGTGLGLAIVKHICTNHGGDVQVWSEPGEGSTFTIRLPAARLIDAIVAHPAHQYAVEQAVHHSGADLTPRAGLASARLDVSASEATPASSAQKGL